MAEDQHLNQLLEESREMVERQQGVELGSGLELSPDGYEGLQRYARDRISEYEDTDDPYDLVELSADLKQNVIDVITYREIFDRKLDFLGDIQSLLTDSDYREAEKYVQEMPEVVEAGIVEKEDLAVINGLRQGRLYSKIMELGDEGDWDESNISDKGIFEGVKDVSDAFIADYYFRGGKGLRSTMGQITQYGFQGRVEYETLMMCAAVELFHTSTLAQDDLMDGDCRRRGRASVNVMAEHLFGERGKDIPILVGNIMNTWSDQIMASNDIEVPERSVYTFAEADEKVNIGQEEDILMGRSLEKVDLNDYKQMSMGKTGLLYEGILKMSAENAMENLEYNETDRQDVRDLISDFAFSFNLAFQASDDLLEVVGSEMEKSDSDISNRRATATTITTDRILELEGETQKREMFLGLFENPEKDPWENIDAAEGKRLAGPIYDTQISKVIREYEDVHRKQLEAWAEDAVNSIERLKKLRKDGKGFSDGAANLLGKAAEAMNRRTH